MEAALACIEFSINAFFSVMLKLKQVKVNYHSVVSS